jgi:hypothetical protein
MHAGDVASQNLETEQIISMPDTEIQAQLKDRVLKVQTACRRREEEQLFQYHGAAGCRPIWAGSTEYHCTLLFR